MFRERRWRRYQYNFLTNHKVWERYLPEFERDIDSLSNSFEGPEAGLAEFERARQLVLRYVEIHLLSLLFANLSYQLLGVALRRWVGDRDHQILAALSSAPTRNRTVDGHKAIWKLASLAQQLPAVDRALTAPDGPPSLEVLGQLPDGQLFVDAVRAFLDEYGHRSSASWEIFAPRWCEEPGQVLRMIAGYLEGGLHTDPFLNEERHRQAYLAARETLGRALRPGRLGLPSWKGPSTRALAELTRSYMRLRENQRFYFDRLLFRIKDIYMRVGEQLVQRGQLARADDVVLLTQDEVAELVAGTLAADVAAERIATRRAETQRDCDVNHPDFLVGDGMPVPSAMDERRVLHGQGISPGRIRGKVRVLKDLSDARKLQRGDILVTRATDPGWTPLFLTAGGLVMELGSLLSHGAVVAREYALPAVVNVTNATRRLH
ncbi:MAG: PEP-utilizing enzyme, partial [Myxococcota bacterium]|nr:PEP-utilizing enzyme [Myxococcota bacterium]